MTRGRRAREGAPVVRYTLERTLPITEVTHALAFSPDGALLVVATRAAQSSTLLVRLDDGTARPAPRAVRRDAVFGPDGALYLAGVSVQALDPGGAKAPRARLSLPGHPKGLTRIALSPNGRWIVVTRYLDDVTLWHLGGEAPALRWTTRATSCHRTAFAPDSATLWCVTHTYRDGGRVDTLDRLRLTDDGAVEGPETLPRPAGLSSHDPIFTTPGGLVAASCDTPWLSRLDADTLAPVALDAPGLPPHVQRDSFAGSPDGAVLVSQCYDDVPDGRRLWRLLTVTPSAGRVDAAYDLGTVSAGLIAVSPDGARIAFTRSDTDRTISILRRETA
ncbi:MAG: hypothetical protein U0325_21200 [Polyangiales bacterium]